MKVLVDQSVFLFLKENKISISKEIKEIISSLKNFPKMYPRIANADCKFTKSNKTLKIKRYLNKLTNR